MPRKLRQCTIFTRAEVRQLGGAWIITESGLPEHWTLGWDEVFDMTEFRATDQCQFGLLGEDWQGFPQYSVLVENNTTGEVAIFDDRSPNVIELREKEEVSDGRR